MPARSPFPAGRTSRTIPTRVAAALRETREEIGLPEDRVRVIGRLDAYVTRTGYRVTPVVGLIRPPFTLQPDPGEVADVFEVPLAFVVDPANHQLHSRLWQGVERHYYVVPFQDRYIWGATAGMLVNFARMLARP